MSYTIFKIKYKSMFVQSSEGEGQIGCSVLGNGVGRLQDSCSRLENREFRLQNLETDHGIVVVQTQHNADIIESQEGRKQLDCFTVVEREREVGQSKSETRQEDFNEEGDVIKEDMQSKTVTTIPSSLSLKDQTDTKIIIDPNEEARTPLSQKLNKMLDSEDKRQKSSVNSSFSQEVGCTKRPSGRSKLRFPPNPESEIVRSQSIASQSNIQQLNERIHPLQNKTLNLAPREIDTAAFHERSIDTASFINSSIHLTDRSMDTSNEDYSTRNTSNSTTKSSYFDSYEKSIEVESLIQRGNLTNETNDFSM